MDFVLHQAALRSVPKSLETPEDFNAVNISGTLNMLEASLKSRVKRFVFASSSSIYGETDKFPEREDSPAQLVSPYALTKLAGEYYCRIFSIHHGLATASLRYFNVFGERQAADDEYAVVIPKFITCMLKDERPPVFGTGRQSRDFTYIANVVDANILAAQKGNLKGEVFNIACGRSYSILELVGILNRLLHKKIKPLFLAKRPGDVFKTEADLDRARKILGFSPQVDFITGLKLTVDYFKRGEKNA
jgi:nucleoside-diphosphate-sugar epimerase